METSPGNGAPSSGPQNLQTHKYDSAFKGATDPNAGGSPSMAKRLPETTDRLVGRKTEFSRQAEKFQVQTDPSGTKGQ